MSTAGSSETASVSSWRAAQVIGGIVAGLVGIWILVEPSHAASFLTIVVAVYAITGGIVYVVGAFSKGVSARTRVGHIVLGAVFIAAGLAALLSLQQATAWLFGFVSILVGILWVLQGIVAFTALRDTDSKVWTVVFAVISIVAGVALLMSPLAGAGVLWLLLGISMVIMGVTQVVRGFTTKTLW